MRSKPCQACFFNRFGVRTRIAIPHTCDGPGVPRKASQPYIPTREELDKYLARLQELMQEDENKPSAGA